MEAAQAEADAARGAGQKVEAYVKSAAKQIIRMLAVEAGTHAAKWVYNQVPFPYSVPAAAAAFAVVFGSMNAIAAKLQRGGVVRGSPTGRDSVPAMLTPGEVVANTAQVDALKSFVTMIAGQEKGRRVAAMAAGRESTPGREVGDVTNVTIQAQQQFPDAILSRKQFRREARNIKKLQRQGMWPK
jgi:hypothetical protein